MDTTKFKLYLPKVLWVLGLVALFWLCSYMTFQVQVIAIGKGYIRENQVDLHNRFLNHQAGNPGQYRILTDYGIKYFQKFILNISTFKLFIYIRYLQNFLIFALGYWYMRLLKIRWELAIFGLGIMSWSMAHVFYDSALSFDIYFDVIFYLAGLIIIIKQKDWLIIPLTLLACLNRETYILLPVIFLISKLRIKEKIRIDKRTIFVFILSMIIFWSLYIFLRSYFGPKESIGELKFYGAHFGWEMFAYNMKRPVTFVQLFFTLNLIPLFAIFSYKNWPPILRIVFWTIIPAWFLIHIFVGIMAESRLFLVPMITVFIPAALITLANLNKLGLRNNLALKS